MIDPERREAEPGFFAAFGEFEPELPERPAAGLARLPRAGERERDRHGAPAPGNRRAPGIAAGFTDLIEELRGVADVDLQRDLLDALGGEAAFAVVPRPEEDPATRACSFPPQCPDAVPRVPRRRRRRGARPRGDGTPAGADRGSLDPELGAPVLPGAADRRRGRQVLRPRRLPSSSTRSSTQAGDRERHRGGGAARRRAARTPSAGPTATRRPSTRCPMSPRCSRTSTSRPAGVRGAHRTGRGSRVHDVRARSAPARQPRSERSANAGGGRPPAVETRTCPRAVDRLRHQGRPTPPERYPAATMTHDELSENEFLFTSESVTEGHPDKVADQISDGVLDAVLADDPYGRVACETLVNTGLVVVSGEISTETYVDIQEIAREHDRRSATTTPTSASRPTPARSSTRSTSSRRTSRRASTRRSSRGPTPPTTTSSTSPARATRE